MTSVAVPVPVPSNPTPAPASSTSPTWFGWLHYLNPFGGSQSPPEHDAARHLAGINAPVNTLEESVIEDNWILIESELDRLFQATTNKKADEIKEELTALRAQRRQAGAVLRNRTSLTQVLFEGLCSEDLIHLNSTLSGNDRASICSTVVSEDGPLWVALLRSIYETDPANSSNTRARTREIFDKFAKDFYETKYNKNIAGTMKDLAFFIYNAASLFGLTNRILDEILSAWSNRLTLCLKDNLRLTELHSNTPSLLDSALLSSCRKLLKLHIKVARNSKDVQVREGRLPSKWVIQETARQAELAEIKQKGADAKWEDPMEKKVQHATPTLNSTEIGNTTKLTALLEKTLQFRPPKSH